MSGTSSLKECKILFVGSAIGIFIILFAIKTACDQLNIVQCKTHCGKYNNNDISNIDDAGNSYVLHK